MQLKKKFLSFIFLLFFSITVNGQLNEIEYFTDSVDRYSNRISDAVQLEDGVVYSGIIEQNNSTIPFVSRIDTNGNLIWSTLQYDYDSTNICYSLDLVKSEDNYLYGLSYESNSTSNDLEFLWKVDKTTGKIVYKSNFYSSGFTEMKLFNYDSTYLMATYTNSTLGGSSIAIINKSNGDTLKTANYNYGEVILAVDKNKNILHTIGSHLRKYNGMNLDQVIWERSYDNGPTKNLNKIHRIYIDDYNDLYLFGEGGNVLSSWDKNGIVKKINNSNGNEIWGAGLTVGGDYVRITDMVDKNGYIYATYENTNSGFVHYRYIMGKVFKQSGAVGIAAAYYITPNGTPPHISEQRAFALDVDCNGDIYLNGRYYNSNDSTIQWGVIKVDGASGNKILDKTISNGLTGTNNRGKGSTAHSFKNTILFLGVLNNSSGDSEINFVKYDATTDTILIQKTLGNGFRLKSRVVEMLRHNDSLLVLKQKGGSLIVDLYDQYGLKVWTQPLTTTTSKVEIGGNMVTNGKDIYISSIEYQASNQIPYYSNSSKLLKVSQLDFKTGNGISTVSRSLNSQNPELQDIEILNNKAFVFYFDNSYYFTKWNTGGLSTPSYLGNDVSANDEGVKNKVFHNDSNLIVFCRNSIERVNDQLNFSTNIVNYTSGAYTWYDLTNIADTLYVVGKEYSSSNHSILAFDKKNNAILWKKEFSNSSGLRKIIAHNQNLYVSGINTDHIEVYSLSIDSANVNWNYQLDSAQYLNADVYDMALIGNRNELAVVGGINQTNNTENGIISLLNLSGNLIQNYKLEGKTGLRTYANRIETFQDSGYWIGGSINRPLFYEEGFIYSLNTKSVIITSLNQFSSELEEGERNFIIYPNPSSSILNIEGAQNKAISYSVYDASGKELIRADQTHRRTVELGRLANGIYIIIIESGSIREKYRFIKM